MRRNGFTLIEMLIVVVVLGLLAALAILRYGDLRNRAVAAGIESELNALRLAGYSYWADRDAFPPDAGPGMTPAGLEPYLQDGFQFARPRYTFDWENFGSSGNGIQVGVVVTSPDADLMAILARRAGGNMPYFVTGTTLTYVIVGPDGRI